jgi:hypothetical protein
VDWFWDAYWKENGRDVCRGFSQNAYWKGNRREKSTGVPACRGRAVAKLETKPLSWLQYWVNPALVTLADLITSPAWALTASIVTASAAIVIRFFLTLNFAVPCQG